MSERFEMGSDTQAVIISLNAVYDVLLLSELDRLDIDRCLREEILETDEGALHYSGLLWA